MDVVLIFKPCAYQISYQAKREVRKLFVNCCRVHPERCLELVGAVLTALPQPISQGTDRVYDV